jgi:hypothetical protein
MGQFPLFSFSLLVLFSFSLLVFTHSNHVVIIQVLFNFYHLFLYIIPSVAGGLSTPSAAGRSFSTAPSAIFAGGLSTPSAAGRNFSTAPSVIFAGGLSTLSVHSCETQTTAPRGDAVLCPSFGGSPTPCFGSAQPHDSDPWRGECYCSRNLVSCSLETVHSCETQTTAPRGDAVLCPSFGGCPTPCLGSA